MGEDELSQEIGGALEDAPSQPVTLDTEVALDAGVAVAEEFLERPGPLGDEGERAGSVGDKALDETQDFALLYWIVLGEYRATKARVGPNRFYKYMSPIALDSYKRILNAYFNAATDLADREDAQRLYGEIDAEWRRSSVLEQAAQRAKRM